MITLDYSPDPPLEQVHLSYKDWVQDTPLPRERLRTNRMRMRYATFQHIGTAVLASMTLYHFLSKLEYYIVSKALTRTGSVAPRGVRAVVWRSGKGDDD